MNPPDRAVAEQYFARAESKQDPAGERYRLYVSAIAVDPGYSEAWSGLGHAVHEIGQDAASAACYRRALEGEEDPRSRAAALCNLALRLFHLGRVEEAEAYAREAVSVDPGLAYGWAYLSMAASVRGLGGEELECAERAFSLVQDPITELALAFACLFNRRWIEGLRHFEARFPYRLFITYDKFPMGRWKGEPVNSVMIVCEQGLGDSLSYARFVWRVKKKVDRVIFAVQPELVRLLTPALPGIEVIPYPQTFPAVDAWEAVGSLPVTLGLTDREYEEAPGLSFGPIAEPAGWKLPCGKREPFRIGVCWAGSPQNDIDRWRSMAAAEFLELYRVPGVEVYSFQVGEPVRSMHEAGCAGLLRDLAPWIRDAADAAALLRRMDLVVTVESFLGHLAGAMGLPCWVLYSYHGGDYRLGRSERGSLWYPRHRVFRQGADAKWGPVWARVVKALGELVGERNRQRH